MNIAKREALIEAGFDIPETQIEITISQYEKMYPAAHDYIKGCEGIVHRARIPAPTEWARSALHYIFQKADNLAEGVELDIFYTKSEEFYQLDWCQRLLRVHKDFNLQHDEVGEAAAYAIDEFTWSGYMEAEPLRNKYDNLLQTNPQ